MLCSSCWVSSRCSTPCGVAALPAVLSYAQQVPGARQRTIEGAGHLVPMEQPAALARCLVDWIEGR